MLKILITGLAWFCGVAHAEYYMITETTDGDRVLGEKHSFYESKKALGGKFATDSDGEISEMLAVIQSDTCKKGGGMLTIQFPAISQESKTVWWTENGNQVADRIAGQLCAAKLKVGELL